MITNSFWNILPKDVHVKILSLLEVEEICKCRQVSKEWINQINHSKELWDNLYPGILFIKDRVALEGCTNSIQDLTNRIESLILELGLGEKMTINIYWLKREEQATIHQAQCTINKSNLDVEKQQLFVRESSYFIGFFQDKLHSGLENLSSSQIIEQITMRSTLSDLYKEHTINVIGDYTHAKIKSLNCSVKIVDIAAKALRNRTRHFDQRLVPLSKKFSNWCCLPEKDPYTCCAEKLAPIFTCCIFSLMVSLVTVFNTLPHPANNATNEVNNTDFWT